MRRFDYQEKWKSLLTPEIVSYLTQIHEFKGEQTLFIEAKADTLTQLVEIAKIQSTESSNKIEGIYTSDIRLRELVKDKTRPRTRNEQEIAGYRDVLNTIHESHDHIPPKSAIILQLHRDLYKFESYNIGGKYKTADNVIEEEDSQGIKKLRFKPVPAWETPEAMEELCGAFEEAMATGEIDPLLLIPMFILDFLCIHPFNDGNGRMSRLITLLLMYRSGYFVGQYISMEKAIADTKEAYYAALQKADQNWYEGENDPKPFIKYMLGIVLSCYRDLETRIMLTEKSGKKSTAYDIVKAYTDSTIGRFSKKDALVSCPSLGSSSIEAALKKLVEEGAIIRTGAGRKTMYMKKTD